MTAAAGASFVPGPLAAALVADSSYIFNFFLRLIFD